VNRTGDARAKSNLERPPAFRLEPETLNSYPARTLSVLHRIFQTKSLDQLVAETEEPKHQLKRVLGPINLIALGIGAIIGAGIFALVGTAAAGHPAEAGQAARLGAGPALTLAILLTAVGCTFCALCYAEFASMVPVAGSAYTYSYATLGEIVAWMIGWDLVLEYAVGNIAVAVSWSGYFVELLHGFGIDFPKWLATDIRAALQTPEIVNAAPRVFGVPILFNLPAVFIVSALTVLLVIGIKESARFNIVMVGLKLLVLAFFVIVGIQYIKPGNWHPFMPNGWKGVQAGAAVMFFAYIGFDAVSTTAEETRNPKKNMPIGIIGSLIICAIIYIIVTAVLTGMKHWSQLNTAEPLSVAFREVNIPWAAAIVAFGSVVAHTAVLLVFQLGQPRILFAMGRDGLLGKWSQKVHPRFRTPHVATIVTGVFVAVGSALASLEETSDMTSIGTLSAFILVCAGVWILRRRDPSRPRGFRTPWVPLVPLLGIGSCLYLMLGLPTIAWIRLAVWMVVGLILYFTYGYKHSRLRAR